MDLKEFISTTLQNIIDGVEDAKEKYKDGGSMVCAPSGGGPQEHLNIRLDARYRYHQSVEFDLAVSSSKENSISGAGNTKAGISVLDFSGNINGSRTSKSNTTNRIKFTVPIALQSTKTKS